MKKITLLFAAILFSFAGYTQVFPLDFDDAADAFSPFGGSGASIIDDGGDMVLQIDGGTDNWDGASINFATYVDLSDDANNTITFDIKPPAGAGARDHWFKFEAGTGGPAVAEVAFSTTGDAWQTITLDFGAGLGEYATLAIFTDSGTSGSNAATGAYLFDDIAGGALGTTPAVDPVPASAPSLPNNPNSEVVLTLFSDVSGYTPAYAAEGAFGVTSTVDLGSGSTNESLKMKFSVDSWGQFNNTTVDVSAANFLSFNYYAPNVAPGANGHEFYIMINSGSGEKFYTFKADGSGDEMIVFDAWQTVNIPMSHFTGQGFDDTTFLVWKLGTPSTAFTSLVYFDNIMFTTSVLSDNDFQESAKFKTFPNPTSGDWNVSGNSVISTVAVYDILGKQVLALEPNSNEFVINASSLRTGVYFAKIEGVNGSKTVKLIKE